MFKSLISCYQAVLFTVIFLISFSPALSQSRKEIKKYGLRSVSTSTTINIAGKQHTYTDSFERFDREGNIIEEVVYNTDGTIKKKEVRKYNKAGKLLEESKFAEKGILVSKQILLYNSANDKISEQLLDGSGKIKEWIKYGYNDLNEKIYENQLDETGKVIKKSVYTYDKNGLRKERKVYNSNDELISVRKYTFKTTDTND